MYQVQPPRPVCGGDGVDVGRHHVRLDPVSGDRLGRGAVGDGVDQREQLPRPLGIAHRGEGHDGPDGAVGVLAAIFAHAGDVALDVAGVEVRLVERRIEELDQPGVAADQAAIDALHRHAASARCVPAPERIDQLCEMESIWHSGFDGRAERRAVVEIGPAIPFAVPAVLLDVAAQPAGLDRVLVGERRRRRAAGPARRTA